MDDWNAALEAAANLFREGFVFVRRRIGDDMKCAIEVHPGNPEIKGGYEEACHSTPSDMDIAAVLSLKRGPRTSEALKMNKDVAQMREALEEIREKAATMPNGGAWAGGIATLCLGTLSRPPSSAEIVRK